MSNEIDVNKITAEVITDLATTASKTIACKLKQAYKDIVTKEGIDYGKAFEKYLVEAAKHIGKAKTILYGQVPHDMYSFYESTDIRNKDGSVKTDNVNNILEIGNKIIITGTGGVGKSMLMRHCFLNAIKRTRYIPVLVELRGLNEISVEKISIEQYIYNILKTFGFKLEEKYFKYSLETGCYLILFDGYDEVKNSLSQKITQEIIQFTNSYSENTVIVSSRPLDEFVGWDDFQEYSSVPLSKKQALSLISKLDYDEELKDKFYKQLDKEIFEKYYSFASNPLLLTIMLMTFEGRVSMPDNKVDFYEQAFSTLFHRHDAMKKGRFKREIVSGLSYEEFKKVFAYFCFRTFFKSQYEFTFKTVNENISKAKDKIYCSKKFNDADFLEDMTKAVCMLMAEGLNYKFSHRSFQEYFAAVYTTQLSDEEQKQFIGSWLKSESNRMTSDFLDILYNLQPDRFMKNILYPPMCEIFNMYKENGSSDEWYIDYMYGGIRIYEIHENEKRIALRVNKSYYDKILSYMLWHYRFSYKRKTNDKIYEAVVWELENKYKDQIHDLISFQKLRDDGIYEKAKITFEWCFKMRDYAFQELEKIDINTFGRKRKFESMLEEL